MLLQKHLSSPCPQGRPLGLLLSVNRAPRSPKLRERVGLQQGMSQAPFCAYPERVLRAGAAMGRPLPRSLGGSFLPAHPSNVKGYGLTETLTAGLRCYSEPRDETSIQGLALSQSVFQKMLSGTAFLTQIFHRWPPEPSSFPSLGVCCCPFRITSSESMGASLGRRQTLRTLEVGPCRAVPSHRQPGLPLTSQDSFVCPRLPVCSAGRPRCSFPKAQQGPSPWSSQSSQ